MVQSASDQAAAVGVEHLSSSITEIDYLSKIFKLRQARLVRFDFLLC
jgi:hypothetical protein